MNLQDKHYYTMKYVTNAFQVEIYCIVLHM